METLNILQVEDNSEDVILTNVLYNMTERSIEMSLLTSRVISKLAEMGSKLYIYRIDDI